MDDSTSLTIGGTAVRQVNGLFSLNDLHKAAGGEDKHQPAFFMRREESLALVEEVSKSADSQNYEPVKSMRGKYGGTYACRELVIAYAAWISAAFHLKVIHVFLAVAAPQPEQMRLDYDRISPAQRQDLKEIVDAIVKAGVQTHGETWKRLQHKFKVNSYLELPATQHLEARQYLIAKLPKASASSVVDKVSKAGHGQMLTSQQASVLRVLLADNAEKLLPKEKQDAAITQGWRKLEAHFGVPYRQIPTGEFEEAVGILTRHVAEWELVDATPKPGKATKAETARFASAVVLAREIAKQIYAHGDVNPYSRWEFTFASDPRTCQPTIPWCKLLPENAMRVTLSDFARRMDEGEMRPTNQELADIAAACQRRLMRRMEYDAAERVATSFDKLPYRL